MVDDKILKLGVGRRDYKDRRPGTPIPFHEPDPNRFAASDAIRARLEREAEEKKRRAAENDTAAVRRQAKADAEALRKLESRAAVTRTSIARREIEKVVGVFPNTPEECSPYEAEISATRKGQSFLFKSCTAAAEAMTAHSDSIEGLGPRATAVARRTTILRSALRRGDGKCTAFGWEWAKLVRRRKSRAK